MQRLPDAHVYAACERFLRKVDKETGKQTSAQTVADSFSRQGIPTKREAIYPALRQGYERGFVRLVPPRSTEILPRLAVRYPSMPADTRILDVKAPLVNENLAAEAADLIVELIRRIDVERARKRGKAEEPERVHIAFGAGDTAGLVAQKLARALATQTGLPPLTLHALSSGFATTQPLNAPVAFFSYFTGINHPIDFVGLFCPPVVKWREYKKIKTLPVVKDSFREAKKIDIVVTSLAQVGDTHGMLNMFLSMYKGKTDGLEKSGHIGDIQWLPYSDTKPLTVDTGIRAVTLFDLPELVKMAATPNKHVVLVAGPCNACGKTKTDAIRPLLFQPQLLACNHLLTDLQTAQELLL